MNRLTVDSRKQLKSARPFWLDFNVMLASPQRNSNVSKIWSINLRGSKKSNVDSFYDDLYVESV